MKRAGDAWAPGTGAPAEESLNSNIITRIIFGGILRSFIISCIARAARRKRRYKTVTKPLHTVTRPRAPILSHPTNPTPS
jgi:hypothetical protein